MRYLIFVFALIGICSSAQETISKEGFYFGINVGAFFGNDNDAEYYNADNTKNNSLAKLLALNYSGYDDFYDYLALEVIGDDFTIIEQATGNMNYNPSFLIGGHLGYNFSERVGIFAELGYSNLKAEGTFVIQTLAAPIGNEDNTQTGSITGKENRLNVDLGLRMNILSNGKVLPYIEGGGNLNFVEVKSHEMTLAGITRSLIIYYDPYSTNEQKGTGLGIWLGAGIQFNLNERYYCQLGGKLMYQQTSLADTKLRLNESLFIRFLL